MFKKRVLTSAAMLLVVFELAACGPGGGNPSDIFPRETQPTAAITGPNSFLLFPNPLKDPNTGVLQSDTAAYATAYYEAIDPDNDKDTLDKWKVANGFGNSATGTEATVYFGNVKELGFGRRMIARKNNDGTVAIMSEYYVVPPVSSYSSNGYSKFNLDAAVARDKRWHFSTSGIEYSAATCSASDPAACDNTIKFAKFYTFNPTTGQRLLDADLDGRGKKALPSVCISCHGGKALPLMPADGSPTGKQLFPYVGNSASKKRGDIQAHFQPLIVDGFDFSSKAGYTRADQEAALKTINQMVLLTYPLPFGSVATGVDVGRRIATGKEWDGAAAAIIKAGYGGLGTDTLPNATFSDSYIPDGWKQAVVGIDGENLYKSAVAPSCRICHIHLGTPSKTDISLERYCTDNTLGACDSTLLNQHFYGFAGRSRAHVIDRGNMPMAKIMYDTFWSSSQAEKMATFLVTSGQASSSVRDTSGAVLKPGRPVAVPGPDRMTISPATLSAANSLFASSYSWTINSTSGVSAVATLTNSTSVSPTLATTGNAAGTYIVRLVVSDGKTQSAPADVTVKIDISGAFTTLPSAIRFSHIKTMMQNTMSDGITGACTGCHSDTLPSGSVPIFFTDYDRNRLGGVYPGANSAVQATDDLWHCKEVRGYINFTDIEASPLLRKSLGFFHSTRFTTASSEYKLLVNWILNGAPCVSQGD
jgi:hypothetical protein